MAGRLGSRVYRSPAWKLLASAARQRAGYRCEELVNGSRCHAWANECHHVVPLDEGGPAVPGLDGIVVLCDAHHVKRHHPGLDLEERARWRALLARI